MTGLLQRPLLTAVIGGLLIAWAGIFVRFADLSVATSATWRCIYAFPVLALLAVGQRRRGWLGGAPASTRRSVAIAILGGIAFGADLLLWHTSIAAVGAGLSTVLANSQVAIVPLAAWLLLGERPARDQVAALPVVLLGCVAISGVLGGGAYGADPVRGAITGVLAAIAYTAFLLSLRAAAASSGAVPVTPLAITTGVSAVVTGAWGLARGTLDAPTWPSHGWIILLALSCQVVAWLLITASFVRLPAVAVSLVLPIQPVGSLLLGLALLAERPSVVQWSGAAVTLVGIVVAARVSSNARAAAAAEAARAPAMP